MGSRSTRILLLLVVLVAMCTLAAAPTSAEASPLNIPGTGIGIPSPLDLLPGIPGPTDLIGKCLRILLQDVLRHPGEGYPQHGRLDARRAGLHGPELLRRPQRAALEPRGRRVGAVHARLHDLDGPLLRLRLYISSGSYEAVEALARGGIAAGALALYPQVFGLLAIATNQLTHGITHVPGVTAGLTTRARRRDHCSIHPAGCRDDRRGRRRRDLPAADGHEDRAGHAAGAAVRRGAAGDRAMAAARNLMAGADGPAVADRRPAVAGRVGAVLRAVRGNRRVGDHARWLVRGAPRQAVRVGRRAVRRVQGAADARAPSDAGWPDALARRARRARACSTAAPRWAPRQAPAARRASPGASRSRPRQEPEADGAPSDLQAPRGQAAPRRVLARAVGADHDRRRRCRRLRRLPLAVSAAGRRSSSRSSAPACRSPCPTARWDSSSR